MANVRHRPRRVGGSGVALRGVDGSSLAWLWAAGISVVLAACASSKLVKEPGHDVAAGDSDGYAAVVANDIHAFDRPVAGLSATQLEEFRAGHTLFIENWVPAPAAGDFDGLGPLLNARACSECHLRAGRGRPSSGAGDASLGLLLRVGLQNGTAPDLPHPRYGQQLQDRRVAGVMREVAIEVREELRTVRLPDGTEVQLSMPSYNLTNWAYGELQREGEVATLGARLAPALIGLGLLESVSASTVRAWADPDDDNGDGISGRAAAIVGPSGMVQLGRFGWKATHGTLRSQIAAAFSEDIGITSHLFPNENLSDVQRATMLVSSGGSPEISDRELDLVTRYVQLLAAPGRRSSQDPLVQRGERLFGQIGCDGCHRPRLAIGESASASRRHPSIAAYTDLLLHDLGPDLADGKRDGDAEPSEWRTPPLWGLGLAKVVNGNTRLLHDGRARDVTEAILWHGGEARRSNRAFQALSADDREAVLAFLRSL